MRDKILKIWGPTPRPFLRMLFLHPSKNTIRLVLNTSTSPGLADLSTNPKQIDYCFETKIKDGQ